MVTSTTRPDQSPNRPPILATLLLPLLLAACSGMPEVPQGQLILDTKRHWLCYNSAHDCMDLGLIIANFERDRILRLHGLDPWDYSQLDSVTEFVDLLTTPDQGQHPQQLSRFIYRLPATARNLEAWQVLRDEFTLRGHGDDSH